MKIILKSFLGLLFMLVFIQCDDKDEYYDRPGWLEEPIYEVLKKEGRFNTYLECVDRTDYAKVLKGAALSTVFAPNDDAFSSYMKEKSYSSVADIPEDEVKQIVSYSIVYSKWTTDHLAESFIDGEYVLGAFKRKTNNYAMPYRDPEFDNEWVVDETARGGYPVTTIDYQISLLAQNYKYLPIYSSTYFNSFANPLTTIDYNTFYPNSTYTGKNVQAGTMLTENIMAENGIIHEVSTVNEPLKNHETLLQEPEYKSFKSLLDYRSPTTGKYLFKAYVELDGSLLEMFQKMLPHENINNIHFKGYSTLIGFSPILETIYLSDGTTNSNESERSGNTLLVPRNEILDEYIQNKLLKYYGSMDKLPWQVIATLINTHMVNGMVWPSLYAGSFNTEGEYINGLGLQGNDFSSDGIVDSKMASNGIIYQIDHVIKSRYFETVYGSIFLNPDYLLTNYAYDKFYYTSLKEELMKSSLNGYISERYTLLNFSDDLLAEDGYTYNSIDNSFANSEMTAESGSSDERLKRLMRMHIFPGLKNNEINSEITGFTQSPISNYNGWGFLVNYFGDLIRYKNNQLQAAGNIADGSVVTVEKVNDEYNNGYVYKTDKLLQYSPRETATGDSRFKEITLWEYLAKAKQENPNVSMFVDYVERCLKKADLNELDGISPDNYYTVLMVNNTAMNQAITRGYIKSLSSFTTDSIEAMAQATKFINAHFLQGTVLPDDGYTYLYPVNPLSPNRTLLSTAHRITNEDLDLTNARTYIEVTKTAAGLLNFAPQNITLGNTVLVKAGFGTTAAMRVQRGSVVGSAIPDNFRSNRIASKAVLHEINNFFTFAEQNP